MDEIRCPMCGKPNPVTAEACQHCGAQIKPLGGSFSSPSSEPPLPDWLNEEHAGGQLPENAAGQEGEDSVPDWLTRIRQREQEERSMNELEEDVFQHTDAEETPAWLSDLRGPDELMSEDQGDESQDNWLARLRSSKGITPPEPAPEPDTSAKNTPPESQEASDDDWMEALKAFQAPDEGSWQEDAEEEPIEIPPQEDVQDASFPVQHEENEFSDWLRSLEAQAGFQPPADTPQSGAPAFLGNLEFDGDALHTLDSESGLPEGEIPPWVTAAAGEDDRSAPVEHLKKEEPPDWLAVFAQAEAGDAPVEPTPMGDPPDWVRAFESEKPREEVDGTADELPNWLITGIGAESEAPSPGEDPPKTPGWTMKLGDLSAAGDEVEGSAAQTEPVEESSPDWFAQLPAEAPVPEAEESQVQIPPAAELPSPEKDAREPIGEMDLSLDVLLPDETQPAEMPFAPFQIGEISPPLPENALPFIQQDLPESAVPSSQPEKSVEEDKTDDLAPATLPGWLEAMRPVESLVDSQSQLVDEEQIEISGPLAGLPGVLPSEDLENQYRKPPVYSARLKATERQRAHAVILEGLLRTASTPQTVQKENLEAPRMLIRLGLAAILIFAILYPLLLGAPTNATPGLGSTTELLTFSNQIEALHPGQTVLAAVDYDAGFSGEMRFAAKGVIQRLIQKRLRLVFVSTVMAGPVLAEDLYRRASSELLAAGGLAAAPMPEDKVNLGYLPGGLSSLQELVLKPQQAARSGFALPGEADSPWESMALQGIQHLNDFAAVIVFTDSVDTGRAWIEQTGTQLDNTPLLMVTSAQAGPMLQPYASTGQVDGLLSGLMAGMAYERLAKMPGNAAAYWNAYRYGMYVMVAFLLSGAILRAIVRLLSQRKKLS
ncbi:MAG: hypothetical protein IT308_11165 [Anaerolineaceae bacterium]|nr:hypothetical protein [Anaerolineaceae bacterium]